MYIYIYMSNYVYIYPSALSRVKVPCGRRCPLHVRASSTRRAGACSEMAAFDKADPVCGEITHRSPQSVGYDPAQNTLHSTLEASKQHAMVQDCALHRWPHANPTSRSTPVSTPPSPCPTSRQADIALLSMPVNRYTDAATPPLHLHAPLTFRPNPPHSCPTPCLSCPSTGCHSPLSKCPRPPCQPGSATHLSNPPPQPDIAFPYFSQLPGIPPFLAPGVATLPCPPAPFPSTTYRAPPSWIYGCDFNKGMS